jgi:tetratricopeptide (TPR) repeat protein
MGEVFLYYCWSTAMAKQRDEHRPDPEDPKKKGKSPKDREEDEVLSADEAEVVEEDIEEAEEASPPPPPGAAPKKPGTQPTKIGRAPQPTKIGRAPQPTQLAKKSPAPTMLQPDEESGKKKGAGAEDVDELEEVIEGEKPSKPPKKPASVPDLSLDEAAEVIEVGDEHVISSEVADDDLFAEEEVFEAEAASGPGKTPGVPADEDVLAGEDVLEAAEASSPGAPASAVGADLDFNSSANLGKASRDEEAEERTELLEQPLYRGEEDEPTELTTKAALERTAHFEGGDESSAVDLGKDKTAERPSGVDALAEALESGVDLGAPAKKRRSQLELESDVEAASMMEEKRAKPRAEGDSDIFGEGKGKSAADSDEEHAKTAALEEETISEEAAEDEAAARKSAKKAARKEEAEEEVAASTEDEEEVVSKKKGGTAVATRPRKPKYLRRWVGGFALALLLIVVGGAAAWYFSPGVLESLVELVPASPNDPKGVLGHVNEYKNAKKELATEKGQRTQAEKNLQAQGAELEKEKQNADALRKQVAGLKDSEKAALAAQNVLVEEKVAPPTAKITDLPKFISQAIKDKQEAEKFRTDVAESLDKNKILDKDKIDLPSFDKAMKDLGESKAILGAVNKKLEDANIKESGEKGIDELIVTQKQVQDKLGAVDKALADAMVKDPGAKGVLQLIATRKKLESDRNELDLAINQAYKELESAKTAPPGDPKKVLVAAIKALRARAESPLIVPLSQLVASLSGLGTGTGKLVEGGFNTAALLTEVNYYRLREPFILTPAKQLDTWMALLQQRSFRNPKNLGAAMKDAAWVRSKDAKAGADPRAKALYVIALALRNQEKYAEARQALGQTVKEAANLKTAWSKLALQSLKELTDSSAYYLPLASMLEEQGNLKSALAVLNSGLKAMPNDGGLLARRSLLHLEAARSQGKPGADVQNSIRRDAEAATKDPAAAAAGFYALGQLEETLEQWTKAEDDYRKALKAHKGASEDANRYRLALARLLLLHDAVPTVATPPAPPAKEKKEAIEEKKDKKEKKNDKKDDKEEKAAVGQLQGTTHHSSLTTHHPQRTTYDSLAAAIFGLTLTGVQPPGDDDEAPATAARLKESIDLANELIKSSNPKTKGQGYLLLGQARAKQGKRTEGLQLYVKGMEMVHPGIASKDLDKMIQEHPAFQTPDTLTRPNAFLAERQFGQGLHHYWNKQYAKAEEHFNAAVGFFKQDARYFYFLGLARYNQKGQLKRDAALFAFEQGARLEADNHPEASEVNLSLERLQGKMRRFVDEFRQKAILGAQ